MDPRNAQFCAVNPRRSKMWQDISDVITMAGGEAVRGRNGWWLARFNVESFMDDFLIYCADHGFTLRAIGHYKGWHAVLCRPD